MFGSDLQKNRSPFCMAWTLLAWLPLGACSLRHRLAFCLIDEALRGGLGVDVGGVGGGQKFAILSPCKRVPQVFSKIIFS